MAIGSELKLLPPVSVKWTVMTHTVEGLPLFNFSIYINKINMWVETETKWDHVFEVEEQETGIL